MEQTAGSSPLLILGLAIFGGTLGAFFFQRLRFPQVVAYIVLGLIIGESGLQWVAAADVARLRPANMFALAIIGFLVGGELQRDTFRQYARQFTAILLGEGLLAFVFVGAPTTFVVYAVVGDWAAAAAAGVVFGAIASATDPASTVDVLWEYRSRGVVTTTIIAIVALDDALAMTLYGLGTSVAQVLTGTTVSVSAEVLKITVELGGAIVLGILAGLLLNALLRWLHQPEKALAIFVGILLLVVGLANIFEMDVILATMTLGVTLTNIAPLRSKELFKIVRSFSTPIYVLFFVLVGARLSVAHMPPWLWGLVALYVVGRTAGKMTGAWAGARISGAAPAVQKYTGLGIFAQGGIAVGLSIMAAQHLGHVPVTEDLSLGDMIIFCITATTMVVQLVGPPLIKLTIRLAGEIGRNVTEEDVVNALHVGDVMETDVIPIADYEPVTGVVDMFTRQDHAVFPIMQRDGAVVGVVSLDALKEVLAEQDTWAWLVARDVALPVQETTRPDAPLAQALATMRELGVEQLLVLEPDTGRFAGMLDARKSRRRINEELLRRQQAAT